MGREGIGLKGLQASSYHERSNIRTVKASLIPKIGHIGLTLVELLLVMGILLVIGLLSERWLSGQLPKWRLNGAARLVMSDFLAAKMKAVSQGNKFRITFLDHRRYVILDDDNNNGKPDLGEEQSTRDIQTDYKDVTLSSNNNPIFHPRGTASNLATITLSNSAGSKIITVGITGRVSIRS